MPFDGNGNWTSNYSAVADRDANIKILASRFDNILLADIAQSFENCLTKDMQVKPQTNFNANNHRIINVSNPSSNSDAVNLSTLNSKDALAVHLAGSETITGAKTFTGATTFTNSVNRQASWTSGTAPATTQSVGYNFTDSTGTIYGSVRKQYNSNGSYYTQMTATKPDGSETSTLAIGYDSNGNAVSTTVTPNTTTQTTSTQIATTGWVNSTGNNVVHLSGTETITGTKTFSSTISGSVSGNAGTVTNGVYTTGNQTIAGNKTFSGRTTFSGSVSLGSSATATTPSASDSSTKVATTEWANTTGNNIVHLGSAETITGEKTFTGTFKTRRASTGYYSMYNYNDAITIGTAPSANTAVQFNMEDSVGGQNHRVGGWFIRYNTDGSTQAGLSAYKPDGTVQTNSGLGITYPSSGNPYAYAPTPSDATDSSTKIATTEWINNYITTSGAFSTFIKAAKGGFKLANGLIVNWGRSSGSNSSNTSTITFEVPFTSATSYAVTTTLHYDSQLGTYWGSVFDETATNFKMKRQSSDVIHWIAIGY